MDDDTTEPFGFPAVGRKKLAAAFDGGRLTSDGGAMFSPRSMTQWTWCTGFRVRDKTGILFRLAEAAVLFARKVTTGAGRAGGH